ncbi:MAG: ABC transporter ATP-binding protein [Ktedonobacteraceae bacterium]|nr:ABC transporter ATP-binding protein [Ktedonobacteraceae bacterium]
MEMIRCSEVHYSYPTGAGEVAVLRDLNLQVEEGEHVALIGPSGTGKSTLLKLCTAQALPQKGAVWVAGENTYTLRGQALARFRREKVGLVFQQFLLLPVLTALENVMLPLLPYRTRSELRQHAIDLLTRVGLERRLNHYPDQLSGGEQQRVAIARALIATPPVLFADEPTGSLDSTTGSQVMDLLNTLCREQNCTLIVVTHDSRVASRADYIMQMQDGRILLPESEKH